MNYRLLLPEEYVRLEPIFGNLAPLPDLSYVGVAENGRIRCVMNTHLQLHLDHFWMDSENKELIDWRKIWRLIERRAQVRPGMRVYAAPTFANGERVAEILGFHLPEQRVMVKDY